MGSNDRIEPPEVVEPGYWRVLAGRRQIELSIATDQHDSVYLLVDEVVDGSPADCPDVLPVTSEQAIAAILTDRGVAHSDAAGLAAALWLEGSDRTGHEPDRTC